MNLSKEGTHVKPTVKVAPARNARLVQCVASKYGDSGVEGSSPTKGNIFVVFFLIKWNFIWFKIERKTVTTIIFHSI